jgi:hypothetical protein
LSKVLFCCGGRKREQSFEIFLKSQTVHKKNNDYQSTTYTLITRYYSFNVFG